MLSIGKLAAGPGTGRYYVDQVAQGREDYYSGEGEAPGRRVGAGSARLGVAGRVEDDELLRLLAGQHPRSGQDLGRPMKSGDVAGFDLTFRAPKSVSILFGIGDQGLSAQVRDGHEAAVGEALAYLEREACVVRRGRGGAVQLPGEGFVAAAYRHRASRAGDPLLHTHVVVANAACGPDGRWTALFGRRLYAEAKTAGYAVGDRVIATRNDHRLDVHNGQAGVLTAIEPGVLSVQLSDGRDLELPTSYAEAGHLDHGYALTAHRAQGATVDATFVLGSEELTREWGYTALSRHREEARFYICARPTFVNEPAPALTASEDISLEVLRALSTSRVEELAAPRAAEQRMVDVALAEGQFRDAQQRLADLEEELAGVGFLRRRTRAGLDEHAELARDDIAVAGEALDDLLHDAALPQLATARDPLAGVEPPPVPQLDRGPDLAPALDTGLDLGP